MESSGFPFITPSSTYMSEDLLFFDTFSHSNSDRDNFDLVQFPSPVIIDLIKIVPLGQPVEANIPGNVRLGATNPSKCEIEFFINDLTKQDAYTMTDLGKFFCNEKDTDFTPPVQIQTDGLLLRGSYRTLTLAIFGQIVAFDEKPEEEQAIVSAASPPAQTPASPVASEREMLYMMRTSDTEMIMQPGYDDAARSENFNQEDPTFENLNDVTEDSMEELGEMELPKERNNQEDLSNSGDGATTVSFINQRDKKLEEIDYSNSSDIDKISIRVNQLDSATNDRHLVDRIENSQPKQIQQSADDCLNEQQVQEWYFDIDSYRPKPLVYFPDPSLTLQERTLLKQTSAVERQRLVGVKEVEKVKEMFEVLGCSDDAKTEDWVTLVEDLANDVANMSLSQTVSNKEMLQFLVEQVLCGLDLSAALKQKQTGFKVRHLKAGLKLATILFHCGSTAVQTLLDAKVVHRVLQLYNKEQMSLPLRLHIFKCLNAACDTVHGVEHIISETYQWDDVKVIVDKIKNKLSEKNCQEYESDGLAGLSSIQSLDDNLTSYQYMLLLLLAQPVTRITIAIGNLIKKIRLYKDLNELSTLVARKSDRADTEDSVFMDQNENIEDKARLERGLHLVQDVVGLTKNGCHQIAQPVRYLPARVQFHIKPTSSETSLAFYKWIEHFRIIECIHFLLTSAQTDVLDIEQSIRLRGACLALIQQILDLPRGTQLLLSNACHEQTANLIRNLAQKIDPYKKNSHPGMENLASLCREESLSIATCRDMSLKLAYCFKVLSCIDKLFDFHRELIGKRTNESKRICDPEKVLHQLYIISDHPYGLAAIMKHFSCIGNLDCILRFLDMPDYQKHLEFVKETSVDYVLELVGNFFRLNNNVLEIAEEYLDTLVELCKVKDKTLSTKIKSLLPWLTPFDTDQPFPLITYSEETFRQLGRVVRKSIPDCSIPFAQGLDYELPPQLITAVRILRQLCISPQVESFIESNFDIFSSQRLFLDDEAKSTTSLPFVDSLPRQQNPNQSWNLNFQTTQNFTLASNCSTEDSLMDRLGQLNNLSKLYLPYDESICGDLKYHYGIMELFEQEGLKRLLNTLRELTGNYPRPVYQSAALSGLRGRIVISYIHSVVMLLHSLVCHLIDAKGKEFRDTSIIGVVLETYSLLCFAPKPEHDKLDELSKREELSALQKSITIKYDNYQLAQQAKKLILSILMSYTQICLSVSESEENVISKSIWTKMLKEVLDFTLSAPVFFSHGLDVLTRILPAPLPNPNMLDTIDQEQLFKNINHRKLWSAHLHPLHQRLEMMISNLSLCNQSNIRALLCYLCNQLCDLSSNAACMVAKTIIETLISCSVKLSLDTAVVGESNSANESTSGQASRQSEDPTGPSSSVVINGTEESKFAIRMVLNVLLSLVTNQAFETAFTNQLQVASKKDEKLLANLYPLIKSLEEPKHNDATTDDIGESGSNKIAISVSSFVELISSMAKTSNSKSSFALDTHAASVVPPDELTRINLVEMSRKVSERFNLATCLTKTYRLKVLMDINSRAHRSTEPSSSSKRFDRVAPGGHQEFLVQPTHKPFVAPIRGRGNRSSSRPDSFRSRPQNTSRPPSIHVDDFNDMYGMDVSVAQAGLGGRYGGKASGMSRTDKSEYRMSPAGRYQELSHAGRVNNSPMSGPSHGRQAYYSPGPPPAGTSYSPRGGPTPSSGGGSGGGGGGGGRRSRRAKYSSPGTTLTCV